MVNVRAFGAAAAVGALTAVLASLGALAAAAPRRPAGAGVSRGWRVTARLRLAGTRLVAMAPGGRLAAALVGRPAPGVVWIAATSGRVVGRVALPAAPTRAVFDATGRQLVVTYGDCGFGPVPCGRTATATVLRAGGGIAATVSTGSGTTALAAVPGTSDVLVGADGAGSVDLVDAASGRILHAFQVGSGVLAGLAVDPTGSEAAVANVTAGTVTMLDLATNTVGAVGNVSQEVGAMAFDSGAPYLFVGQAQGEAVDVVHTVDGTVPYAARATEQVGPLAYLPRARVLAAGSLTAQTVVLFDVGTAAPAIPYGPSRTVAIGAAAAGRVAALVPAAGGRELLAATQHGLGVLAGPDFTPAQRLLPSALGGEPSAVDAADGTRAIVLAGPYVDVIATARGGRS